MRVEPGSYNSDGIDPGNLLAGSIFDLVPGNLYNVRLTLSDPDGGSNVRTFTTSTRSIPADPPVPRYRYVVPGTGGGSGTPSSPFLGMAAANAAAAPGDVFLLGPGTYVGEIELTTSGTATNPIVWRGQDVAAVILDGEGTAKPVVGFPGTAYVHLENVTIIRPLQMGIRGSGTTGIVIRGCVIDSSQQTDHEMEGIYFLAPGDRDAFISENKIRGPFNWSDGRGADAYGIVIGGTGHVIRCNEVYDWWDGIDVGKTDPTIVTEGCDIYQNEIHSCTDDGIETDGSRHNIRVYENRITNCLCGISCQPVYGGPIYIVRNVVYNWQLKPLKFHIWPTGMIVFNNTFAGADPRGWGGGEWRNALLRNNLFLGGSQSSPSGDPIPIATTGVRADLDYDGWRQVVSNRFADFNAAFYATLADFDTATSQERHGILVDYTDFVNAQEPELGSYLGGQGYPQPTIPGTPDLRLRDTSASVDAGIALENITDGFAGTAPDLGAYELGMIVPAYGPAAAADGRRGRLNASGPASVHLDGGTEPCRRADGAPLRRSAAGAGQPERL